MSRTLASLNVIPYSNQYPLFEGLAEGFQRGPKSLQPLRLAVPSVPALPKDDSVRDRFAMARAVADRFDQYAERRTIGSTEKWAQTRQPISQVNTYFGQNHGSQNDWKKVYPVASPAADIRYHWGKQQQPRPEVTT